MKLLYDTRNRTLRELKEGSEEIDLTPLETRFLNILCTGDAYSWKDIYEYMYKERYNEYNERLKMKIKNVYRRLSYKLKLNLRAIPTYGIALVDEVFVM